MFRTESKAPPYEELRPLKPLKTRRFPVYPDLANKLVATERHPDPTVAHVLGTCAGYAYSEPDTVAMIMARMGLKDNRCLKVAQFVDAMLISSTSFLVQSEDGGSVILCYRGTEPVSLINWLTDVDVNPEKVLIEFQDGTGAFEVHGGFYRNMRATRYQVVAALERALEGKSVFAEGGSVARPLEALYITGHSLGGAMAALTAVTLVTEPAYSSIAAKLKAVYTFGQPMIGSPALAEACDRHPFLGRRVLRYVYANDIVPQLPPKASGPFAHFGPEFQYKASEPKGDWERNHQSRKQLSNLLQVLTTPLSFLARQLRSFRNVPFRASIYDHFPHRYIAALKPSAVLTEFGE
jgi:hypothetical protein